MKNARMFTIAAMCCGVQAVYAQVPEMINAFEAGGRAMGAGGSLNNTTPDTLSATNNPAALGYVNSKRFAIATRNFPTTRTIVTGPLTNLRLNTTQESGDLGLSHIGYAQPMSGNRGTLGVAWTVGAWMHDDQFGANLPNGISRYLDAIRVKTDFMNISWGKASPDMSRSVGVGLVVAYNNAYNRRRIVFTDPEIPPINARSEDSDIGFGLVAGILVTPSGQSNLTYSLSAQTPITTGSEGSLSLFNKIPGRVTGGVAVRQEGYRGGKDFAVYGGELRYYFGGENSDRIQRDDVLTGHVGIEYNYHLDRWVFPIRFGYAFVPAGGDDFDNRDSFTYGFGIRPSDKNWGLEVNFGRPNGGGRDTSILLNYKF